MPIFEYKCTECNSNYDIFHRSQNINKEEIVCPKCGSKEHKKLLSTFKASVSGSSSSDYDSCSTGNCGVPAYTGGGCANGMCGLN